MSTTAEQVTTFEYDPTDEDFDGLICACGRPMHTNDADCRHCWREREHPES